MNIVITGAAGFLGQLLAGVLLREMPNLTGLTLLDRLPPPLPSDDGRVTAHQCDLSDAAQVAQMLPPQTDALIHLAAIVSSQAEQDGDLSYRVNVLASKHLMDQCRHINPNIRFLFASSLAVYGGTLPAVVDDRTPLTPQSTYGTHKHMVELLLADYRRKGWLDGLALRLPTVCIRPGKPNQAASSFVSSIIREPLHGEQAVLPVDPSLKLWIAGPLRIAQHFCHALTLDTAQLPPTAVVNLPGLTISVQEMLDTLAAVAGRQCFERITARPDAQVARIVAGWPARFDTATADTLGFGAEQDFSSIIAQYMHHYLERR